MLKITEQFDHYIHNVMWDDTNIVNLLLSAALAATVDLFILGLRMLDSVLERAVLTNKAIVVLAERNISSSNNNNASHNNDLPDKSLFSYLHNWWCRETLFSEGTRGERRRRTKRSNNNNSVLSLRNRS